MTYLLLLLACAPSDPPHTARLPAESEAVVAFIREDQRRVQARGDGWRLWNEAGLRVDVGMDETVVAGRCLHGDCPDWQLRMGWGGPGEAEGTLLRLRHPWGQETLDNRRDGVEQVFVVERGPVDFRIPTSGLRCEDDTRGVRFYDGPVERLRYHRLRVLDAAGRKLDAQLRCEPGAVRIVADTEHATHPIRVDPLLTTPESLEGDTGAEFGTALASVGDVNDDGYPDLLVGGPTWDGDAEDEGRAWLFFGSETGLDTAAGWTADPSDQVGAGFGTTVAALGDIDADGVFDFAVGAPDWTGEATGEGRVWAWLGASTVSSTPAVTLDPTDTTDAAFGSALSGQGDTDADGFSELLVGAPGMDGIVAGAGAAYLYDGTGSGLALAWSDGGTEADSEFGTAVALVPDIDGDGYDEVAVGAPGTNDGYTDEGIVAVYAGSATGPLTSTTWAPADTSHAGFGGALAAGDLDADGRGDLVAAAPTMGSTGQLWAATGSSAGLIDAWDETTDAAGVGTVLAIGDLDGDGWGDLAAGCPDCDGTMGGEGRVQVWFGSSDGLASSDGFDVDGTTAAGRLGASLAVLDADADGYADLVAGVPGADALAVYGGSAEGLGDEFDDISPSNQTYAYFGWSVAGAGDVDGDGFGDFVVGAPEYDAEQDEEGRAYLLNGEDGALSVTWYLDPTDDEEGQFGYSVAGVGDVNGDGYADVLIGAPGADGSVSEAGGAYLFHGSSSGLASTADWSASPCSRDDHCGYSVASAGDVNGDGYPDVVVGAPGNMDTYYSGSGTVYVYHGGASGLSTSEDATLQGDSGSTDAFGSAVGTAGDFDGDGDDELLVGAPRYSSSYGRFYLFPGDPGGLSSYTGFSPGDSSDAEVGGAVQGLGDVDGDGYDDFAVGAPGEDYSDSGETLVYYGAADEHDEAADLVLHPTTSSATRFGSALAAGDFDGDGLRDLVAAGPTYGSYDGKVWVYAGSTDRLDSSSTWTGYTGTDDYFGSSVGSADVNGDGRSDLLVGEHRNESIATDEGAAWLFVSGGEDDSGAADVGLMQSVAGTRVGAGIWLSSPELTLSAWALDPAGRGPVRLQAEVKPVGTLFDGEDLLESDPVEPASGAIVSVDWAGGGDGFRYHWRARLVYATRELGRWVTFGDNRESLPDFAGCWDADGDGIDNCDGDCDDGDASVFPGGTELCNGLDDDCDGALDDDETDADADGVLACEGDCDDGDATVYPGAPELCDSVDNDCDGALEDATLDEDGDGHPACGGDCDDSDATVHPGATELCDGVDQDCDGDASGEDDADGDGVRECAGDCDDGDASVYPGATELCDGADQDCDGAASGEGDADGDGVRECAGDCDDGDATVHPGATEACDGVDGDCDGDASGEADADGDGVRECAGDCDDDDAAVYPGASEACDGIDGDCDGSTAGEEDADGDGQRVCAGDCDDADASVYTGATEACDGIDQDCDGSVSGEEDADGDGQRVCAGDCDDADAAVYTGATESCDGLDSACDGVADEADDDGDGWRLCAGDCDDSDPSVYPRDIDDCDGIDDDCDGVVDEDDVDDDGDGVRVCDGDCDDGDPSVSPEQPEDCTNGVDDDCDGTVDIDIDKDEDGAGTCSGDCDDTDASVHPGATETCDGIDQDCDGLTDEDYDVDGDGWTTCEGDCRDHDATIHPGAEEICDGADQDCDGEYDELPDLDGDGTGPCEGDCDDDDPAVGPHALEDCGNEVDDDCDGAIDVDDPDCPLDTGDTGDTNAGASDDSGPDDGCEPDGTCDSDDGDGTGDDVGGRGTRGRCGCAAGGVAPATWVILAWALAVRRRRGRPGPGGSPMRRGISGSSHAAPCSTP
ncbi:MAG: MopE-related protein [Pseudomonadota bacterium]